MHEGHYCRYTRAKDGTVTKADLGTRTIDEYIQQMLYDASSPQQIDDLAEQCLEMSRRLKTAGIKSNAKKWKDAWQLCKVKASKARERIATFPTKESHPDFFMAKTVGAPGQLYDNLRLPQYLQFHLDGRETSVGIYEKQIVEGVVYRVSGMRALTVYLEPIGQDKIPTYSRIVNMVPANMLRGMMALGRIQALDPAEYSSEMVSQ